MHEDDWFNSCVDVLELHLTDADSRKSVLQEAFYGNARLTGLNTDGNVRDALNRILRELLSYGKLRNEKWAVNVFLEVVKKRVGIDVQHQLSQLQQLYEQLKSPPPISVAVAEPTDKQPREVPSRVRSMEKRGIGRKLLTLCMLGILFSPIGTGLFFAGYELKGRLIGMDPGKPNPTVKSAEGQSPEVIANKNMSDSISKENQNKLAWLNALYSARYTDPESETIDGFDPKPYFGNIKLFPYWGDPRTEGWSPHHDLVIECARMLWDTDPQLVDLLSWEQLGLDIAIVHISESNEASTVTCNVDYKGDKQGLWKTHRFKLPACRSGETFMILIRTHVPTDVRIPKDLLEFRSMQYIIRLELVRNGL
jgi:hypothetical protein